MKRGLWIYAAGLATYGLMQFAAGRYGDRQRRRRDLAVGPLPNVVPITNRRNPA